MKKLITFFVVFFLFVQGLDAQKNERTFIFGNSLINHEFQVIPTPSQETSVPYWFKELADSRGYNYEVSGQYGFLPQHANLPPIAQWGFDNIEGAWESDYEPFSEANFTSVMITPGNFIQFQGPSENYPYENVSPLSTTVEIFEWCVDQEPGLNFYIYENWPDMAGFLNNGFPPSESEWQAYNNYLNGEFHDWFVEYLELVRTDFGDPCVRFIPVGTAISHLLKQSPFDQIPITELYEDDAPHGRATTYLLASIVTYMVMYEERILTTISFGEDDIIHPLLRDNYSQAVEILWDFVVDNFELIYTGAPNCELVTNINENESDVMSLLVYPNPVEDMLHVEFNQSILFYSIISLKGQKVLNNIQSESIDVSMLSPGQYMIIGFDQSGANVSQLLINKI
jgi:hypothetical protein